MLLLFLTYYHSQSYRLQLNMLKEAFCFRKVLFFLVLRDEGRSFRKCCSCSSCTYIVENLYVTFSLICGVNLKRQIHPVVLSLIRLMSSYSTLASVVPGPILSPKWHILQCFMLIFLKILLYIGCF